MGKGAPAPPFCVRCKTERGTAVRRQQAASKGSMTVRRGNSCAICSAPDPKAAGCIPCQSPWGLEGLMSAPAGEGAATTVLLVPANWVTRLNPSQGERTSTGAEASHRDPCGQGMWLDGTCPRKDVSPTHAPGQKL